MSENYYDSNLIRNENTNTLEDMGHGGATGATIGGILGLIIAVGGIFIVPGIGIIIAGPLAGLVVGTLMGTLLALGVSESKAQEYAEAIETGKIILYVEAMDNTDIGKKWAEIKRGDNL